jgi:hypothetical protein
VSEDKPKKADDSRTGVIVAAVITAIGGIVAAVIVSLHGPSSSTSSPSVVSSATPTTSTSSGAPTLTTNPPQPQSSPGSLADLPQSPGGRLDSGGVTFSGVTYTQSFQLAVPSGGGSYSYDLGGQWSKIELYVNNEAANGAIMALSVFSDDQATGSDYLVPQTPYAVTLSVTGVQTLTISFQNSASLNPETVQVAGNLTH